MYSFLHSFSILLLLFFYRRHFLLLGSGLNQLASVTSLYLILRGCSFLSFLSLGTKGSARQYVACASFAQELFIRGKGVLGPVG